MALRRLISKFPAGGGYCMMIGKYSATTGGRNNDEREWLFCTKSCVQIAEMPEDQTALLAHNLEFIVAPRFRSF